MEQARRPRRGILGVTVLASVVALGAAVTAGADSGSPGASAESLWRTTPVQQHAPAPDGPGRRGFDCPEEGGRGNGAGGSQSPDATASPTAEV